MREAAALAHSLLRIGASHAGRFHAGPRPRILRGSGGLYLRLRTSLVSDAVSSREPVPTSLENALQGERP